MFTNYILARIGLEEGQLVRDAGGNYSVQYYLIDQVGNVRAVLQENGSLAQVTEYYAFGLPVTRQSGGNKYLYNGKEQQPQTNWSDFGARMYDATLGRWLSVDPLGEVSRRWSPYTYVYNNPVRFVDPDGMLVDSDGRAVRMAARLTTPLLPYAKTGMRLCVATTFAFRFAGCLPIYPYLWFLIQEMAERTTVHDCYTRYLNAQKPHF